MRSSKVLAAVLSLTLAAGAAMPINSYVPSVALTASAEESSTVETDELVFEIFADHAEVIRVNDEKMTKCTVPAAVNKLPVTRIAQNAFFFSPDLQEVTLPASVTAIGDQAFSWCTKLKSIKVDAASKDFTEVDGILFSKSKDTLVSYPAGKEGKSYTVPDSVKKLASFAFMRSQNLEAVTVPESVTYIGQEAFCTNIKLRSVTILNPDCEFEITSFICNGMDENFISHYYGTVTGYEGSTTELMSAENNYEFIGIPNPYTTTTTTTMTTTTTTTTTTATAAASTTGKTTASTAPSASTTGKTTASTTATGTPVTTTTTAPAAQYKLGDVNSDGKINASDATAVLQYYARTATGKDGGLNKEQQTAADVNKDGKINSVDATIILSYYAYCGTAKDKAMPFEEYLKAAK